VVKEVAHECEPGAEVTLQFFSGPREPAALLKASVVAKGIGADDVAMLALTHRNLPTFVEEVRMGSAADSQGHHFQTYGFRQLKFYRGLPGFGIIVGYANPTPGKPVTAEELMLSSQHLAKGMSGAPILDEKTNLVVGVCQARLQTGFDSRDRDTSFAVDAIVLSKKPFNLQLVEVSRWKDKMSVSSGIRNDEYMFPFGPAQAETEVNLPVTPIITFTPHTLAETEAITKAIETDFNPKQEKVNIGDVFVSEDSPSTMLSCSSRSQPEASNKNCGYSDNQEIPDVDILVPVVVSSESGGFLNFYPFEAPLHIVTENFEFFVEWDSFFPLYRKGMSIWITHDGETAEATLADNDNLFPSIDLPVRLYRVLCIENDDDKKLIEDVLLNNSHLRSDEIQIELRRQGFSATIEDIGKLRWRSGCPFAP
jgi:hypothetical protein